MLQFDNVSVVCKANLYFDGNVSSRTVIFADGSKKTLGIMLPGEYEFKTDAKELMEIYSGELEVQLPDTDWIKITGGGSFEVPANASFKGKIHSITDYCCSFLK